MTTTTRNNFWLHVGFGAFLLIVVFLTPDAGRGQGHSFITAAIHSQWSQWGDWPAAWCSIKIILLTVGAFLVVTSLFAVLEYWTPKEESVASLTVVFALSLVLGLFGGLLTGLYLLMKAVF